MNHRFSASATVTATGIVKIMTGRQQEVICMADKERADDPFREHPLRYIRSFYRASCLVNDQKL
jgi:hypothetical protein